MRTPPRVLNLRTMTPAQAKSAVRVDRRTGWGNPFVMRRGCPVGEERERVCDAFERWVRTSEAPGALWIRQHVRELAGKDLACWCAPSRCHADTLLRLANEPEVMG